MLLGALPRLDPRLPDDLPPLGQVVLHKPRHAILCAHCAFESLRELALLHVGMSMIAASSRS